MFAVAMVFASFRAASPALAGAGEVAAEAFLDYCYDPVRLEGRVRQPDPSEGWAVARIDPDEGPEFLKSFEGDVYIRNSAGDGSQLLMVHEPAPEDGQAADRKLIQHSCRLVQLGNVETGRLKTHIEEDVFPLDGYRLHSAHPKSLGLPAGWREWCWSAMPRRDMGNWELEEHNSHPGQSACIYFTNEKQYNYTDLVTIRVAEKPGEAGIVLLQLDRTFRPRKGGGDR